MMVGIKPIETGYKGYLFRSRLEARWAVFFDTLGIEWEYEPEGYVLEDGTWYLPDFWLPYKHNYPNSGYFVEIKGREPTEAELAAASQLAVGTGHHTWIFSGSPGKQRYFWAGRDGFVQEKVERSWEWDLPGRDLLAFQLWGIFSRWDCQENVERAIYAARSARFGERRR